MLILTDEMHGAPLTECIIVPVDLDFFFSLFAKQSYRNRASKLGFSEESPFFLSVKVACNLQLRMFEVVMV